MPLLSAPVPASASEPLVFLGDRDLPPYEFLEDGEPRGANVDLARAIGRVLGRPVEIRLMDWADAQAKLRAGEGHALTMFGQTEEREATHDFTQTTFPVTFALFVRADEAGGFAAGTRLEGRRVGATRGGLARQYIAANHPEATLVLVDDRVQGTRKLLRGEIDALASNAWAERHVLRDLNVTGVAELPAFVRRTGNIAVRNGESALLAEIDGAVSALKASGEFDAIIDRWSRVRVHLLPDWVVRSAAAGGAAALLGLAALGLLSWRLSAGKRALASEVVDRARTEEALRASEERLALASAAAGMGVWDWDAEAGTAVVNAEFRALYGLAPGDGPVSSQELMGLVHPEDRERVILRGGAALSDGGGYHDEFRINRADTGEERWLVSRGRVMKVGPRRRLFGATYDVTERRAEQARQTLLAREVDHRAKNVLAVVSAIVKLTRAEDPRQFAQAVEGRVAALTRAHTLLASDRWTGAGLEESVREELAAYEGGGRVMVQGPSLRLLPESVQPVSMVLHELATNAAKYGALSLPGGRVEVSWHLDAQGSAADRPATMLRLSWTERGGPALLAPPERGGFGSRVIEATVKSQLGGAAEMHWDVEGLRCEIAVPSDRVLVTTAPGGKQGRDATGLTTFAQVHVLRTSQPPA